MRATEKVLRQYYQFVTGKLSKRKDWGSVLADLKKNTKVNPKVVQVLDQIRDLYRNPLMHPETFLTMDEALILFDISKAGIASMAGEIVAGTAAATALASVTAAGKAALLGKES